MSREETTASTPAPSPACVFLVGAGPGNTGLLTLRAAECLQQAQLVVYDQLVSPAMLAHAPTAQHVCVNELHERHAERAPRVIELLIRSARAGRRVVRLKGGDPYVFGRGAEEAEALYGAGIPFEVVPGVTAAVGAAAFAGIPLTHRLCASAVALVTGHEQPDKGADAVDWDALARFPGTLAIYMGLNRLPAIVQKLLAGGKDPETPAAAIRCATTGEQRTITAVLRDLPEAVRAAGLSAPLLTVVGEVVRLRPHLDWFSQRPLLNRHVLVTRPRHQAAGLVAQLEQLGAVVSVLPTVEVREPSDWGPVDRALAQLSAFHWLVFTSANGVHFFLRRLRQTGRDLRVLGPVKLAVIGPATADALRTYHLEPDLMPAEYRSECLADALADQPRGQRLLLARADRGREVLREQFAAVATVEQVAVYSQVDAVEADPRILADLRSGPIEYVTLTSANIFRSLLRCLDEVARERLPER